uniref:Receptor ligand binding region domain-containing protein n=2 Tax=Plectus sambesii TaxID=2011161 RepID=A0A914XAW0_9BILA
MRRRRQSSNLARPPDGFILLLCIFALAAVAAAADAATHKLPYNVVMVLPQYESVNDKYNLTILKARPVIDISVEDVVHKYYLMPLNFVNFTYHDSRLWEEDARMAEKWATMGVVRAYCQGKLDAVLGFADPYSLSTTAKISAGWGNGIPVITTTGLAAQMGSKKEYPYLTRMQGSYRQMADSIYQFIANGTSAELKAPNEVSFGYKHLAFMYHDKRRAINRQQHTQSGESIGEETSSHCYFSLYAIKTYFMEKSEHFKEKWKINTPAIAFDENPSRTPGELAEWLKMASNMANGERSSFSA